MRVKKNIFFYFLLLSLNGFTQDDPSPFKIWQLMSFSGEARIKDNFRQNIIKTSSSTDKQSATFVNGILMARTKSYVVHPNFMEITANGIYNPTANRSYYVNVPDFLEKTQTQGFDIGAIFLKQKPLNFTANTSRYSAVSNVQNLARVRSNSQVYGTGLNYTNKILPFSIAYSNAKTDENTIGTNRTFKNTSQYFQVNATKSFSSYDNSSFFYVHSDNTSTQNDDYFLSPLYTNMISNMFSASNSLVLVRKRWATLSSSFSASNTNGSFSSNSISGGEGLGVKLHRRLNWNTTYGWGVAHQAQDKINKQEIQSTLTHQLFESLNSRLFFRNNISNQTTYKQQSNAFGLDLRYMKKIPHGKLSLFYMYTKTFQKVNTPDVVLNIYRESHVLDDAQIVLLNNENIDMNSVVVKDVTGTKIYLLNVDYTLIQNGPYVEIIRVLGSPFLPNLTTVYIDYRSTKAGEYKFSGQSNSFSANTSLYGDKLFLYYNVTWQGFNTDNTSNLLVLNHYTRQIMGTRVHFNHTKGGVEYEYVLSNIMPYHGMRYFIQYQGDYKYIYFSLYGNLQDMEITNENARRQNISASASVSYSILRRVSLHAECMFNKWLGQGTNTHYTTSRIEATYGIQKFSLTLGAENYWNYTGYYKINYRGLYIQLSRKF